MLKKITAHLLILWGSLNAASITWIATSPQDDMNLPSSWSPSSVPGTTDDALFDSSLSGIDLRPSQYNQNFFAKSLQFVKEASPFTFIFNNHTLSLSGAGITGAKTNTTIQAINTNNPLSLGNQISFTNNSNASSGMANFVINNLASQTGSAFNSTIGSITNQCSIDSIFSSNGSFTFVNNGQDTSSGIGGNQTACITSCQLQYNRPVTVTNNTTISISNNAIFDGNNSTTFNYVGSIGDKQFEANDTFTAGDFFSLEILNSGTHNGNGVGSDFIGIATGGQAAFLGECTLGDHASISITNSGVNTGQSTLNVIGYSGAAQLDFSDNFTSGIDLTMTIANTSINTGNESNTVGAVVGSQVLFEQDCIFNAGTLLSVTNTGNITNDQLAFNQGFTILEGKATFHVSNQGTIGGFGILIQGSSLGGNVDILLENTSCSFDTDLDFFTIGKLNGDGTSTLQSYPPLIINTEASDKGYFAGSIEDFPSFTSSVIKQGLGFQQLSGDNNYSGLTSIQEGTLSITGSLLGDVTVESSGTLSGSGQIGGAITIQNGGTLFPDNSIEQLRADSLFLEPSSLTTIALGANSASSIVLETTASIDGILQVETTIAPYPHEGSNVILLADTISGIFSHIQPSPGFVFSLNYLDQAIYLNYSLSIPLEGLKDNSLTIANYLNTYAPPSNAFTSLAILSGDTLNTALNSVCPAENAFGSYASQLTAFSLSRLVSNYINTFCLQEKLLSKKAIIAGPIAGDCNQVSTCEKSNTFSGWISGFGEYAHQKSTNQLPSFHYISEALLGGLDYKGQDRSLLGSAFGYAHIYVNSTTNRSNINDYFAALYGNIFIGDLYLSPAIWGIFNQISNQRTISFPGFNQKAKANIYAWQLVPHLELGYEISTKGLQIIPFSGLDWSINWQRSYIEKGAQPFNTFQNAQTSSMARSETGLKFYETWKHSWGTFMLKEKISYVFAKPFGSAHMTANFGGTPPNFTVTAITQNLNLCAIGINCTTLSNKLLSIDFGYEGEFGSNYFSNQLMITVDKRF